MEWIRLLIILFVIMICKLLWKIYITIVY
jgi:hypothetical protein